MKTYVDELDLCRPCLLIFKAQLKIGNRVDLLHKFTLYTAERIGSPCSCQEDLSDDGDDDDDDDDDKQHRYFCRMGSMVTYITCGHHTKRILFGVDGILQSDNRSCILTNKSRRKILNGSGLEDLCEVDHTS
jgi:hypothetical protein